jgi:hypothetical protein
MSYQKAVPVFPCAVKETLLRKDSNGGTSTGSMSVKDRDGTVLSSSLLGVDFQQKFLVCLFLYAWFCCRVLFIF